MLIGVAGMVGAGKSTLSRALAARFGLQLALESVDEDNPWLERFYGAPEQGSADDPDGDAPAMADRGESMRRYALHLQLHFLSRPRSSSMPTDRTADTTCCRAERLQPASRAASAASHQSRPRLFAPKLAISRGPSLAHRLHSSVDMRHLPLASLLALAAACTGPGRPTATTGAGQGKADGESSCPIAEFDADKISAAIDGAGSCYTAAGIAESCAFGSSLDVSFVSSATAICQRGFGAMTAADTRTYETLLGKCAAKYENQEGTLYRSMNAYCDLEITKLFTAFYPEPEYGEDAVSYSEECPVAGSDADKIEQAIASASSCSSAASITSACAWGSSIDTQFVAAASEVCSGETGELTTADATIHDGLIESCNALYTEGSGTLQLSVAAMCRLQVDVVFNTLSGDVE